MFILVRALVYATLFVGILLVFLPAQVLARAGIAASPSVGTAQVVAMLMAAIGAAIVLWCILSFVFIGKGTQAPFDPPRLLVIRGPYRFVRNPMYIGAGLAGAGAVLYYGSLALFTYMAALAVIIHLLVIVYEEPTLRRSFPGQYEAYCAKVGRWWPRF